MNFPLADQTRETRVPTDRFRDHSLYHPPRYPVGCHLYGAVPRASAGGHDYHPRSQGEVEAYKIQAARQSDIDREALDKEKTGVFTGSYAINPVNGEKIPIWIADYVLMTYGTGAIMAVPAHDQRDFEFARKFGIEIRVVIQPDDMPALDGASMPASVPASGTMVNSGPLTGTSADASLSRRNQIHY